MTVQNPDCDDVSIWDSATQTSSVPVRIPEFGNDWTSWITQGAINNSGDTIILNRGSSQSLIYDGGLAYQGTTVSMAWGTFGLWDDMAIIVEAVGDENPSNRISILDAENVRILDTLVLPEKIGIGEYNFGSKPIELTGDCQNLLVVGQTGLYIVDTSAVPEPATLLLFSLGGLMLRKRNP